jgi:predicted metalloprotease with PDZ domain
MKPQFGLLTLLPLVLAVTSVCSLSYAHSKPQPDIISYNLSPKMRGATQTGLNVQLKFKGNRTGSTFLVLPTSFVSQNELWRLISDVRVRGGTQKNEGPNLIKVTHAPNAPIVVNYTFNNAFGEGVTASDVYRKIGAPIVQSNWFALSGYTLFVRISNRPDSQVKFQFSGFPSNWLLSTSLELAEGPISEKDIGNSTFVGGLNYRKAVSPNGLVSLLTNGDFSNITTNQILESLTKIITFHQRFWADAPSQYMMAVAALPSPDRLQMSFGFAHKDAFLGMFSQIAEQNDILFLLAHESLHNWIAGQTGGIDTTKPLIASLWFREGFTDFYAMRTLLASGVWSAQDWVDHWNSNIRDFHESPLRNAPTFAFDQPIWNQADAATLPYRRGALIAASLDQKIRQATRGDYNLDEVMLQLRATSQSHPLSGPQLLPIIIQQVSDLDLESYIDDMSQSGADIYFPSDGWGKCLNVTSVVRPKFDVGFDRERTFLAGNIVTGLKAGGSAYQAGLRNGMKLLQRTAGELNNTDIPVTYEVEMASGDVKALSWLPRGEIINTQVLALGVDFGPSATSAAKAACLRLLAGG